MAYFDTGEKIREIRKERGLNQDQLAELASLNRVTVAKYESGKVEPGAHALSKIADALEVSTDVLLGRSDEPPEHEQQAIQTTPQIRIVSGMMMNLPKEVQDQIVAIVGAVVSHQKEKDETNDQ